MTTLTKLLVTTCALLVLAGSARAEETKRIRRFAFVIGANDGGTDRVKLRYAGTDAQAVAGVLEDLGGVSEADMVVLLDPHRADLDAGFDQMRDKIAAAVGPGVRTELIVYYSGHSDDEGLLLHGVRYSYKDLRAQIRGLPADVHIAILDSCASGAFTRRKGGRRVQPFLVDESTQVKGYAFLTSSSADEAAQESDRIAASFFTHFLVSGMRGGADANRDGRVTLNEAYQFAHGETVSRTESTQAGAQHPAYDIHLVGTGDVVMTDLRATSAALVVASDVDGRLYIEDASGRLVIELDKPAGRPMVLGLGPDDYGITLARDGAYFRAVVQLARGRRTTLAFGDFAPIGAEPTVVRGGPPGETPVAVEYRHVPFALQFVPTIGIGDGTADKPVLNNVAINVLVGKSAALRGIEVGGIANVRTHDVRGAQIAGVGNYAGASFTGIQVAGAGNYAADGFRGAQASGAFNMAMGSGEGIQVSGAVNVVEQSLRGGQASGAINAVGGNFEGVQVAGAVNWVGGGVRGAQIGVVNIGGSVDGAQIGVVNIARRSRGLQLGVVNVSSENDGVPLGLVSVARNGRYAVEGWTTDTGHLHAGLKLGTRRFYTLLAAGADDEEFLFGLGLGVHTPRDGYYVDVDVVAYDTYTHDFDEIDLDLLGKLRLTLGFQITRDMAVFGGASANMAFEFDDADADNPSLVTGKKIEGDSFVLRLSPGFFAGVSF